MKRWPDLEKLFGARGACGGCWCMWWKLSRAQWSSQKGNGNKMAFKGNLASGNCPGLIAYVKNQPVAWCAVEPREAYPVLNRSRSLKRIDDQEVWSVTCFFVDREYRSQGLSVALLEAAKKYARRQGGQILEGYPVRPKKDRMPDAFAWTGLESAFKKAGFEIAARRGSRVIMRSSINASPRLKT